MYYTGSITAQRYTGTEEIGIMQWEYTTAYCYLKDMTPPGAYRIPEYVWRIKVGADDFRLDEGLNHLGRQQWELVVVQQERQRSETGGELTYVYVFKRPTIAAHLAAQQ
jgi:hypothetical protein